MNKLLIIGASGHGKVVAEIARKVGYSEIAFLDDNPSAKTCGNYPVVGTTQDLAKFSTYDFIVGIGASAIREQITERLLSLGIRPVSLLHPNAVIAADVSIGFGTVVMPGAIINPGTSIGNGCIINTGATVDHDNIIADYVHVSVGSHLAGTVTVGRHTWIGVGSSVSNNIKICENAMIGAGAVVVRDLSSPGTYVGVPARLK